MPFGPTWSAETRERVGRLYLTTDLTLTAIAERTGVPAGTISGWVVRYGWRVPRAAGQARRRRVTRSRDELDRLVADPPRGAPPRAAPGQGDPGAGAPAAEGEPPSVPDAAGDLAGRLEAVAGRAVASLEATIAAGRALDPERAARALASLTQTLRIIAGLKGPAGGRGEGDHGEPPPRPLAELLAELEGHRRRLRAERRARRGAGGVRPP